MIQSKRRVLLIEPNYKNKYPPMGLMKIAMYHRLHGDDVVFWKGDFKEFVLRQLTDECIEKICEVERELYDVNDPSKWRHLYPIIKNAIKNGSIQENQAFKKARESMLFAPNWIEEYRKKFRNNYYLKHPIWDRVCVTSLFTFCWDETIEAIEFAKQVCKDISQVFVGGVMASVVPNEVEKATGIKPHVGILNITHYPGDDLTPEPFANTPIDALPLDYSILEEIDYQYPETNAYYGYCTRGCVNHCKFCAVPVIEPNYCEYIPLEPRLYATDERFGQQRNLLLLDNNAFASKCFDKIIDEIHDHGFQKGGAYIQPNQLEISIKLLREGWNDRAYLRKITKIVNEFVENNLKSPKYETYYASLISNKLLHDYTATKEGILNFYELIKDDFEKQRYKRPLARIVDFNQGLDARLATPERMKKLSTIAINPLRIAFDAWETRKHYVKAIKLASQFGINQLSNYILYNFTDQPIDLYNRLLINIDLCDALSINIYSFPMKYHPIADPQWFSNRDFIGEHWSRKSIRTVQAVLNSTHGKIGKGRTFFFKAFGRNQEEFSDLIMMPEAFIIKRWDAEIAGLTDKWRNAYKQLEGENKHIAEAIINTNMYAPETWKKFPITVRKCLELYLYTRETIPTAPDSLKDKRIAEFEESCPVKISEECKCLL